MGMNRFRKAREDLKAYIVADDWLLWRHAIEEAVHGLHELFLVVRDPGFDVQCVE